MTPEEYQEFIEMETWSEDVAAELLAGISPHRYDWERSSEEKARQNDIWNMLDNAANKHFIKPVSTTRDQATTTNFDWSSKKPFPLNVVSREYTLVVRDFRPEDIINWALKRGLDVPEPLMQLADCHHQTPLILKEQPSCGTHAIHKLIDQAYYKTKKKDGMTHHKDVFLLIKAEFKSSLNEKPVIDTEHIISEITRERLIKWRTEEINQMATLTYKTFTSHIRTLNKKNGNGNSGAGDAQLAPN